MARGGRDFESSLPADESAEGPPLAALEPASPILELVRKLKESISDKDRIINERTRELKEARRRLENIVASIGDAVLVLGPEGTIETVNAAALELTGFDAGELL
ncbi:PAS domain-containing protein, partial [bacterium]|nr:PAS domain-containing protein [bacterium]